MSELTKQECEEAVKDDVGCSGYASDDDSDELCEQCKNCTENTMHESKCCGSRIIGKINFYDLVAALEELSDHYGVNQIDHLIEELNEAGADKNIIIEQDGFLTSAFIDFDGEFS